MPFSHSSKRIKEILLELIILIATANEVKQEAVIASEAKQEASKSFNKLFVVIRFCLYLCRRFLRSEYLYRNKTTTESENTDQ
jgi:hypothetical protein